MSDMMRPKVALLMGGLSAEREVSLSSGRECARALRGLGYEVTEIDVNHNDYDVLARQLEAVGPDVVFNALHGCWGEDGIVQGILEDRGFAYTHSGVRASALAMDKVRAKAVFRDAGLPVPDGRLVSKKDILRGHIMDEPYVIKPVNGGSSIGVLLIMDLSHPRLELSSDLPATLMVERFIEGRELTVSVLGDEALAVTEIISEGWYDYEAKYVLGRSRHVVPADIPGDIAEAALNYALKAHKVLGCCGLTRSDFRWNSKSGLGGLFLLEINTQPGMTPTSLSPEQARFKGMDFPALCEWIVKDATCNR